ncbi:Nramp family divalent metal transporter [Candidatus Woesebacteria bacterium]|nr:Nramp family divalent metal transporter [Candidatus Woesebacteria bacterium]
MPLVDKTKHAPLPVPPSFWRLIGPSFILLGLGLGSGELILWPYLTANYGLGIIWGAVVGITLQFFLNMEVERYTLAKGESVFVGLARKLHLFSPIWFFISTLIPWLWPGIIATGGLIIAHLLGWEDHVPITIGLLICVGLLLSTGKTVYKRLETWQRWSISLGVPFILALTLWLVHPIEWQMLAAGMIGRGEGFTWFPTGLSLMTFLGALAYSGAGGNLNLAQSFYIKDKGYGMGKHSGQITSLIRDSSGKLSLEGFSFKQSKTNIALFHRWWRLINIEHAIVFWLTGLITMLSLATLSYATVFRSGETIPAGVDFLFIQAQQIGILTFPLLGTLFLVVTAIMLFSTQTSIFDATSRIMAENIVITNKSLFPIKNLGFYYYGFLWLQILMSIVVLRLGFTQPFTLVIISAVLNALSMGIYSILLFWLNTTQLAPSIRPNILRRSILLILSIFFAGIAIATFLQH